MAYHSSITTKYGDLENVKKDAATIFEIYNRQGPQFLIDCVSEVTGNIANTYTLGNHERNELINSLVKSLEESLQERL